MTSEPPLLQPSHNAQRKFPQLWELSRMITLVAEVVKSTGRNPRRAACVALMRVRAPTLKKSTPLMPDRLRRRCCAAAPFQISIRAAAALTFSSAHFSSASTGVACFSRFTNTLNWAVSVPFALDPCLREQKVRLLKAASALLEVFTAGNMLWLKPINLTSMGTWCDSFPGAFGSLLCTCWGTDWLLCCSSDSASSWPQFGSSVNQTISVWWMSFAWFQLLDTEVDFLAAVCGGNSPLTLTLLAQIVHSVNAGRRK